jgi:hypothetical protein
VQELAMLLVPDGVTSDRVSSCSILQRVSERSRGASLQV